MCRTMLSLACFVDLTKDVDTTLVRTLNWVPFFKLE